MRREIQTRPALQVVEGESPLGRIRLLLEGGILVRIGLPGVGGDLSPGEEGAPSEEEGPALRALRALRAWFDGDEEPLRRLPHRLEGTPFRRRVWKEVSRVPRGEVRTYREISLGAFGSARYARAVGGALRANPLPLLVPCHRVIGSSGELTGFGGSSGEGIRIKRKLLEMEGSV